MTLQLRTAKCVSFFWFERSMFYIPIRWVKEKWAQGGEYLCKYGICLKGAFYNFVK